MGVIRKNNNIDAIGLENEARSHIPTNLAAYYLNRAPQTLRIWATYENGPLRPIRISSRLAWPVEQIKKILKICET